MKSTFVSKRKARKIQVDEDEDDLMTAKSASSNATEGPEAVVRKPVKKSHLRKSLAFTDESNESAQEGDLADNEEFAKPTLSRSPSATGKTRMKGASRLSFGSGEIISGDAAEALVMDEAFIPPKKTALRRRVVESNALRNGLSGVRNLSCRLMEDDDDGRPTYSKDYLTQLKNSTPSAPKHRQDDVEANDDAGNLDVSELDGATIVTITAPAEPAYIPSSAEILEKKQRRARLAREQDFISFSEIEATHALQQATSLLAPARRKRPETRLVREDEDLAEGFDDFVDDGRIALGKKAERAARRARKEHMAAMILEAEGASADDDSDAASDDSEAERVAAYEAAQTRAGMDGLASHRPGHADDEHAASSSAAPPRVAPLPVLSACLERLQTTLQGMEQALERGRTKMAGLEAEKARIEGREGEVQRLLREAGERYAALRAGEGGVGSGAGGEEVASGARGEGVATPQGMGGRGLESFGGVAGTSPWDGADAGPVG